MNPVGGIALLIASYLTGGIPFSYLAGRISRDIDLREVGSGNLGATNAIRELGWGWGVAVLILDAAKGYLAIYLALAFATGGVWPVLAGLAAILGHSFTPYLGFKGGKGVATSAGVILCLAPAAFGIALAIFLMVTMVTRYVSVGSLAAATAMPLLILWRRPGEHALLAFAVLVAILIWFRHRTNLSRLSRGEESPINLGRRGGA